MCETFTVARPQHNFKINRNVHKFPLVQGIPRSAEIKALTSDTPRLRDTISFPEFAVCSVLLPKPANRMGCKVGGVESSGYHRGGGNPGRPWIPWETAWLNQY